MVGTLEKLPFFLSDHGDDDAAIAAAVLVFNASLAAAALGHRATTVEGTFTGPGDTANKASNSCCTGVFGLMGVLAVVPGDGPAPPPGLVTDNLVGR